MVDDERGILDRGEEGVGIWRFGVEPTDGPTGTLIAGASQAGSLVQGLMIA